MKNRKKDVKLLIIIVFTFTLGIVTSGLTISYAAETLSSKNVYYNNTNSGGSSTNVSGAIDELYATADDQDILKAEIKSELMDTIYPKGSVYISTTDSTVTAVETRFPGTKWELYSTGKTLIGAGTGTDSNNISKTFTVSENNSKTGAYQIQINETNLPSHSHGIPSLSGYTTPTTHTFGVGGTGQYSVTPGGTTDSMVLGTKNYSGGASQYIEIPSLTVTTNASNTTTCTNCSQKAISVQDPYTVVYMYKRID